MYPLLYPPTDVVASTWALRGSLYYGGTEVAWTADLIGDPPFEVVLPEGAYFDGWQRDWLSSVRIRLEGRAEDGAAVALVEASLVFVVWPDGEAIWLDREAASLDAPNGAWSVAEQDALSALALEPGVEVMAPVGGAR